MRILIKLDDNELLVNCDKVKQKGSCLMFESVPTRSDKSAYTHVVECGSAFDATVLLHQGLTEGYMDLSNYECDIIV